jgi:hypothetical protein
MKKILLHGFGPLFPRRRLGAAWDGSTLSWATASLADDVETLLDAGEGKASTAEEAAALGRGERGGAPADPAVALLPQKFIIMRAMKLPSTDPAELEAMAALQAGRLVPLPPEEIISSVEVMGEDGEGSSDVLLYIARREEAERVSAVYAAAGFAPTRLAPAAAALACLAGKASSAGEPALVVEAGRATAVLAVVLNGKPLSARAGPADRNKLPGFLREFWETHRKNPSAPLPARAWAGGEEADSLRNLVEEAVGIRTDVFPDGLLRGASPSAAGAALLPPRGTPDLSANRFPGDAKLHAAEKKTFAILILAFFAMAGLIAARAVGVRNARAAALEGRWKSIAPSVKELQRMETRLAVLRRAPPGGSLADLLAAMNRHLPPQVSLTALTYERGKSAVLHGQAFALADAVGTVNALQKSGLYESVGLRSSNIRPLHGREVVDFQIELIFSKEGGKP